MQGAKWWFVVSWKPSPSSQLFPVPNIVYRHVYTKYTDAIRPHAQNFDEADKQHHLGKAEKIGDTFEIAFAFMWFQSDADAIWQLSELLEWEFQHFQRV